MCVLLQSVVCFQITCKWIAWKITVCVKEPLSSSVRTIKLFTYCMNQLMYKMCLKWERVDWRVPKTNQDMSNTLRQIFVSLCPIFCGLPWRADRDLTELILIDFSVATDFNIELTSQRQRSCCVSFEDVQKDDYISTAMHNILWPFSVHITICK